MANRKYMIVLLAQIVISILVASALADDKRPGRYDKLSATAQLWEYSTLCEFNDSKSVPDAIIYMKGNFTSTGCQDLADRYGKPIAVAVKLYNDTQIPLDVTVPMLNNVVCKSQNGTTYKAIALRKFDVIPGIGRTYVFLTEMTNNLKYKISSGKQYDLIFLFKSAKAGDMIYLGDSKPLKIDK